MEINLVASLIKSRSWCGKFLLLPTTHREMGVRGCSLTRSLSGQAGFGGGGDGMNDGLEGK
jgi:hypothetical protein